MRMQVRRVLVRGVLVCVAMLAVVMPGCQHTAVIPLGTDNKTRVASAPAAATWAQPVDRPGLPNFYKVSDDLYRGAQPTAEGVEQLKALGIKTIINLRSSDTDKNLSIPSGIAYETIPMTAWRVDDAEVVRFLQIVGDRSRLPAFVHCRRGADRTGLMVAIYRVAIQSWDKEQAIAEMTEGGFRFYSGWQNLVRYIRDVDIDAIKRQAGLTN